MPQSQRTYFETELDRIYHSEPLFRPEQYARVRRSKALMEEFYSDRIELDDLAKQAYMSRFHYVRVFQRMYGLTPRVYLRDLRISKAKELIKAGLPITRVCSEIGYQSMPTSSSVFKKCTGHTPKAYQHLQNSNRE
ncbi:hypothetical protein R50073_48890 (plasmid) [Maricurvus nonylphenolicus]|uniref:helix-turn-helix domain-containing protein n=1 Tax=Maricurvus nonylphenolicus TaxID=1008307 RepID=UPI0036F21679